LSTTVQPQASTGPSFHAASAAGSSTG
jgi:hypothetical protein